MGGFFGLVFVKGSGSSGGGGGLPGRFTLASAAGAVNNVTPTGFPGANLGSRLIVTLPSGVANWTGLLAGADGQEVLLMNNDAANALTLKNQNAGSLASARFIGPNGNDFILPAQDSVWLIYDATLARWLITP